LVDFVGAQLAALQQRLGDGAAAYSGQQIEIRMVPSNF
jgi:hypothetical protein